MKSCTLSYWNNRILWQTGIGLCGSPYGHPYLGKSEISFSKASPQCHSYVQNVFIKQEEKETTCYKAEGNFLISFYRRNNSVRVKLPLALTKLRLKLSLPSLVYQATFN